MSMINKAPEKPVRINGNERMRTFNEKVRNGIEHALNFMLSGESGVSIHVSAFEPFLMPIETYFQAYKKNSVLVKTHVEKTYEGEFYWFFEMKAAIALGGMLRMLPAGSLAEKVNQGTFDATDQDAFGEVGNQLNGILDRAFRSLTNKDIHLRMDFQKKVYPNEKISLETFRNHEEYVVLLTNITIPSFGTQKLTLLLPRSFYEVMLNLEVELEGIQAKRVLVYSWNPATVAQLQASLNSRYTKVIPLTEPDDLLKEAEKGAVAVGLELKGLTAPLDRQQLILFKRFLANRLLMRLPIYLTSDQATDELVAELKKLGFPGATKKTLSEAFPSWTHSLTSDPSWTEKKAG